MKTILLSAISAVSLFSTQLNAQVVNTGSYKCEMVSTTNAQRTGTEPFYLNLDINKSTNTFQLQKCSKNNCSAVYAAGILSETEALDKANWSQAQVSATSTLEYAMTELPSLFKFTIHRIGSSRSNHMLINIMPNKIEVIQSYPYQVTAKFDCK